MPRTVIVTGAGHGIGSTTAGAFAQHDDVVVVADIDTAAADDVAAGIPGALSVGVDVADPESVEAMVATVVERTGSVDVLVNNAMVISDGDLLDLAPAQIRRDLDIDLTGAIHTTRAVLPMMFAAGGGVILNVASVNGMGYYGNPVYSAAKAGLINLTRSVAVQYGRRGIRCNAVSPGTIASSSWDRRVAIDPEVLERAAQWYPLGRVGTPQDVADALVFLASAQARWITGAVLPVDGGLTAGNHAMATQLTGD